MAQAARAFCPEQGVRHSLPPGTAAMESLPAPHLPPIEGESVPGRAPPTLPSSSFFDQRAAALSALSRGLCPSNSTGLRQQAGPESRPIRL